MQPNSTVSYDWKQPSPTHRYHSGVSLHSHTSHSIESLTFIHTMFLEYPLLRPVFAYYERVSRNRYGIDLDFIASHWRPPLLPRMAYDLECRQILDLGLHPLVSITDHDDIQAPLLLRTIPSARRIPVSLEWTISFGSTSFHLGIHNLPSAAAPDWMNRLAHVTEQPDEAAFSAVLRDLHSDPQILIVLNHPFWDLYKIGEKPHAEDLNRFLRQHGECIHALELNGLRHARENQEVMLLARAWSHLLISGGDRHGLEPSANINLTNAATFTEFVREIREDRRSHILFLEQYRAPWEQRILDSTLDAIADHAQFSPGWQRWDERAFHPDAEGVMRPLAELWPRGKAPRLLRLAIAGLRLTRYRTVGRALRLILPRVPAELPQALDGEVA